MAQGPIDYTRGFAAASPLGGAFEAMQAGARFGALEQQRNVFQQQQMALEQEMQAARAEQERRGQINAEVEQLLRNPFATSADYQRLVALTPKDQSKAIQDAWAARSAEEKANILTLTGQIESALASNKPEIAQRLLNERADAEANSGRPGESRQWRTWAEIAQGSPDAMRVVLGRILATVEGGGAVLDNIEKVRAGQRAQEAFGPEQRKRTADAILAELKSKNEPARFGAELGLTEAQTAQARAATAAHAAARQASEATRTAAEAEARRISEGVVPPEKRPEAEGKLRGEYRTATTVYQDVRNSFGRVQAAQDTAVGDLSLIFGYMKMLDPGSVVREGEFATAQNAAGVPERILNVYNRVRSGERLTENQRGSFKKQAEDLFNVAANDERRVRDGISRIARNYGLNTDNIFIDAQPSAPAAPERPAAPPPAVRPSAAPAAPVRGPVAAGTINRAPGQGGAAPATRNVVVDF